LGFTVAGYLAVGEVVHTRTPLRSVCLTLSQGRALVDGDLGCLAQQPFLGQLEALQLRMPTAESLVMARSPQFDRLSSLELSLGGVERHQLRMICAETWAPRLTGLRLCGRGTRSGPYGDVLAAATSLANLQRLELRSVRDTAGNLRALVSAPQLQGV